MAISITPTPRDQKIPVGPIVLLMLVLIISGVLFILFSQPKKILTQEQIIDKFLPKASNIRQIEKVDLDFEGVINHPVFRQLREFAPLPISIPPRGKSNPFL
jgi:hypothetical protein